MDIFHFGLCLTALLCTLVAGFVFAFAIVVMPGIGELNNREYLQAFQNMDRVIQNNHPVFMLVWVGSMVLLIVSGVLGFKHLEGGELMLLIAASVIYLVGVQLPTMTINIPLNNQIQALDIPTMDEAALATARQGFESRWVRWNTLRTIFACVASLALIFLTLRL